MTSENLRTLSPTNKRYLDKELYDFLKGLMREKPVTYKSDHADFVHNEVVRAQLRIFESCIGKRK